MDKTQQKHNILTYLYHNLIQKVESKNESLEDKTLNNFFPHI